ncbi:unnamed protein product [Cochlearia groenlandica]
METYRYVLVFIAVVTLYSVAETTSQGGDSTQVMACMQKLMPCKQYLHVANPPPSCCGPMKEIVEKDATCLCTVFNNPEMLKALNLTKENALDLPKACGTKPNISLCTKIASSSPIASPVSTNGASSLPDISFMGLVSAFVAIILF